MVNIGFPAPSWYGFEMVDAPGGCHSNAKIAINRKFTPNQISRIFGGFSKI
jgi:hypothetical protein